MPSKTHFWYTHSDDNLSLLHVTSTDPRRNGEQDLALFNTDVYAGLIGNEWRVRHGRIENQFGKSFLSVVASLYKLGSIQIEPNVDFTRNNFRSRAFYAGNIKPIQDYQASHPNWRIKTKVIELFPPMKYKKQSDWCELQVEIEDSAMLTIKINKCLVRYVPKKLVYRQRKSSGLYLWPDKKQTNRYPENRHGAAFSEYLLTCIGEGATTARHRRADVFDFRVNMATGKYITAVTAHNKYTEVAEGVLLEIHFPIGYGKAWTERDHNMYPAKREFFEDGEERKCYFLLDNNDKLEFIKEYDWTVSNCHTNHGAYCAQFKDKDTGKAISKYPLEKFVCQLNGVEVGQRVRRSQMNKFYARAIDAGVSGYARRAKFENTIVSDASGNQKMFTKAKIFKYRRLHCDKYVAIPELGIKALDVRFTSIRIGGSQ